MMITGIGTPSSQSSIPLPIVASFYENKAYRYSETGYSENAGNETYL